MTAAYILDNLMLAYVLASGIIVLTIFIRS